MLLRVKLPQLIRSYTNKLQPNLSKVSLSCLNPSSISQREHQGLVKGCSLMYSNNSNSNSNNNNSNTNSNSNNNNSSNSNRCVNNICTATLTSQQPLVQFELANTTSATTGPSTSTSATTRLLNNNNNNNSSSIIDNGIINNCNNNNIINNNNNSNNMSSRNVCRILSRHKPLALFKFRTSSFATTSTETRLNNSSKNNSNNTSSGHICMVLSRQQPSNLFKFGSSTAAAITAVRQFTQDGRQQQTETHREEDGLTSDYTLVYKNSSIHYYRMAQLLLQPTSGVCGVAAAYLAITSKNDFFVRQTVDYFEHPFVAGCAFFMFNAYIFYLVTELCRCYLLRIYVHVDDEHYVGIVPSMLPMSSPTKLNFTAADINLTSRNFYIPFKRGNSVIKGRPFILHSDDFRVPKYHSVLYPVQYDKDDDDINK